MLRLDKVSISHHSLPLVHGVSADLCLGSLVGLVGPNGAGKSTLLKGIAGIWKVASGKMHLNEEDLLTLSRKERSQRIAYVPQTPHCHFPFTVKELVSMGRYPLSAYGMKEDPIVENIIEQTDLQHLAHRQISEISGGERQRAYIARALATEAPVLLLDEPTSSLDLRHQLDVIELLHSLRDEGRLVVVAIHDLHRALEWTDQLLLLDGGKLFAFGAPNDVLNDRTLSQVFKI